MQDQTYIWTQEYDRQLSSWLSLQDEIAGEVSDGIQRTLGVPLRGGAASQRLRESNSDEAYDLYLKGRYFWNKRTSGGLDRAVVYFQQAIDKDPNYARAYAGLADSYALMGGYQGVPTDEPMTKARDAALHALALDESLSETHTALGLIAQNYDWDWKTAEKEYRRAIELDPNFETAHHWYAEYLALTGHFDEAHVEIEKARKLDPLSLIIAADDAAFLYFAGKV